MPFLDGSGELNLSTSDALGLAQTLYELNCAADLADLARSTCASLRRLLDADGVTFVLSEGEQVHYAEEDAPERLWKGRRFPASACISGWAVIHNQNAVIEDIYADSRIPVEAYRPTFVKSLAMVPLGAESPQGALGVYWARTHRATARELFLIERVADAVGAALARLHRVQALAP